MNVPQFDVKRTFPFLLVVVSVLKPSFSEDVDPRDMHQWRILKCDLAQSIRTIMLSVLVDETLT